MTQKRTFPLISNNEFAFEAMTPNPSQLLPPTLLSVPTESHSVSLLHHYDTQALGDFGHFMYHLTLLTLVR